MGVIRHRRRAPRPDRELSAYLVLLLFALAAAAFAIYITFNEGVLP